MIKALIFDFDGLILDTETPDLLAWRDVYSRHGQVLAAETWGQFVGGAGATDFEPAAHLSRLLGGVSLPKDSLYTETDARRLALIHQNPVLPGVTDYLTEARRLGLGLAVASSSPHAWVDGHLRRLGLFDRFDAVICSEDVPPGRTKPHPDLFLRALAALHARADEAVVLEDSPNGVKAARAAGIFVVAVPNPVTVQLSFDAPNLRLNALTDMPLVEVLKRASRSA